MFQLLLILHLLGAAVWAGGHLVLSIGVLPGALRRRDARPVIEFESRYERIGIPALLVQVVTGLLLARRYVPLLGDWFRFDNHLSTHIVAKLVLLAVTLILALHARLRLLPRLEAKNLPLLALHIGAVTLLAIAFVAVGAGFRTGGLF